MLPMGRMRSGLSLGSASFFRESKLRECLRVNTRAMTQKVCLLPRPPDVMVRESVASSRGRSLQLRSKQRYDEGFREHSGVSQGELRERPSSNHLYAAPPPGHAGNVACDRPSYRIEQRYRLGPGCILAFRGRF